MAARALAFAALLSWCEPDNADSLTPRATRPPPTAPNISRRLRQSRRPRKASLLLNHLRSPGRPRSPPFVRLLQPFPPIRFRGEGLLLPPITPAYSPGESSRASSFDKRKPPSAIAPAVADFMD